MNARGLGLESPRDRTVLVLAGKVSEGWFDIMNPGKRFLSIISLPVTVRRTAPQLLAKPAHVVALTGSTASGWQSGNSPETGLWEDGVLGGLSANRK